MPLRTSLNCLALAQIYLEQGEYKKSLNCYTHLIEGIFFHQEASSNRTELLQQRHSSWIGHLLVLFGQIGSRIGFPPFSSIICRLWNGLIEFLLLIRTMPTVC